VKLPVLLLFFSAALAGQNTTAQQDAELWRERWEKVPEVLKALELKEGQAVADVGAGSGFYSVRLAKAVGPTGRVYAEDINDGECALGSLRKRVEKEKWENITVIRGEPDDPKLPVGALDAALMVDAYHEMEKHPQMLQHVLAALKPGGRLVVVDLMPCKTRNRPRAAQVKNHRLAPELAEPEFRQAGFQVLSRADDFIDNPDEENGRWMMVARRPSNF
jgi:ubiquinone/menaquinone biosynthesis C-methylase UbiE